MVLAPRSIPSQTHPGRTTVFMLLCAIVRVIITVAASPCFPWRFKSPHDRPDMRWNFGTWVTRKVLMVSSFYNGAGLNKYCGLVQIVASYLQPRQPCGLYMMEQILKESPQNLFHHVQSTWEKSSYNDMQLTPLSPVARMPRSEIRHLWDIFKLILKLIRETIKKKKNPVNINKNQAWEPMYQKYKQN